MWFTEHDAHNIARITPAGTITEFGIPSGAPPYRIAAGPDGNLWFTEPGSFNAIGRCTPTGGISEYPIPTPNTDVEGITAGPDKNMWFAEPDAEKIARISNLTGGGNLSSATGSFGTTLTISGPCTKDTDCMAGGNACGGDVCSHKGMTPQCVFAVTSDPGYCNAASDCWCAVKARRATRLRTTARQRRLELLLAVSIWAQSHDLPRALQLLPLKSTTHRAYSGSGGPLTGPPQVEIPS